MLSPMPAPLKSSVSLPTCAVDSVVVVAGIPDETVVAGAQLRLVVPVSAGHDVVAAAADEDLVADAADERVVVRAAVDRDELVAERATAVVDRHLVVAAAGVHVDRGEVASVEAGVSRAVSPHVELERGR